jgi:hypothetical protein
MRCRGNTVQPTRPSTLPELHRSFIANAVNLLAAGSDAETAAMEYLGGIEARFAVNRESRS